MSLGLTPYEFVQQVFYVQEKVLLDFHPDDDVYKEVLTEANLVLQELQKEEDWLWLRDTVNLGFVMEMPPFTTKPPKDFHWCRFQHDIQLEIPENVYKPSRLYGDCVRLCRYRVRDELFHPWVSQMLGWKEHWQSVIDSGKIEPDRIFIKYGEIDEDGVDVTGYKYGGSFTWPLSDLTEEDLPRYIKRGKWYTDSEGNLFVGDIETANEDPHDIYDTETPMRVYMCYLNEIVEPIKPEKPFNDFDPVKLEPAPHGYLEALRYWWPCSLWPLKDDKPFLIWDDKLESVWQFIEIFENDAINVPYMSAGNMYHKDVRQTNGILQPSMPSRELGAIVVGNRLTFNRPLNPWELNRVALMDVQLRIEPFHICDDGCKSMVTIRSGYNSRPSYPENPCEIANEQAERRMLREIPDPNYVIYRTAALHAQGSPPAQGRIIDLTDTANKLLSAMRQNNAEATTSDMVDWQAIDFVNVL